MRFLISSLYNTYKKKLNIEFPFPYDSILLASNNNNGGDDSDWDSDISDELSDRDSVRGTNRVVDELAVLDKARKGDSEAIKEIEEKHLEGKPANEKNLDELEKTLEESYKIQDGKEKHLLEKIDKESGGNDTSSNSSESIDELSYLVKENLRITRDINNIEDELAKVDRAEKSANKDNEDEKFLSKHYGNESYDYIREYLNEEKERLIQGKKDYKAEIAEARSSKDHMEVDSLTENKRKESTIEDTNPSKRKKSWNDDSSGPSGPSAPSGSSTSFGNSSNTQGSDGGNTESGGNNASKIIGKLLVIIGSILEGLSSFFDNIF